MSKIGLLGSAAGVVGKAAKIGGGLLDEILELYKTEPLTARKLAKRSGILDEIDSQIPRPKGDVSNATALRAAANAQRVGKADYKGQHSAPMSDGNAPLHDLSQAYPEDIYSSKGLQYYGTGDNIIDSESMGIINSLRGKPDQTVTMYRSVPSDAGDVDINAGDWVSLSESYVKQHGESALSGDYKIISKEVPASQLFTNGDSINEFGFDPSSGSLVKMLAKGKADGTVVNYPDELIESTPFELRKAIADHNESVLGPEYRQSFEDATYYRGGGSERSALKNDVWMSSDPYQASTYAGQIGGNVMPLKVRKGDIPEVYSNSTEWNRVGLLDSSIKIPSNEYPEELGRVMFNSEQSPYAVTDTNKIAQFAKDKGFGGASIKGLQDIGPYQRGADLSKVRRAESLMLGDGSNARSVNAAFDPAKASSSNLLASNPAAGVGAGVLGAIGASQSNKTYADYSPANLARLRNNDVGSIQAPQSMAASNIAGLMGSANKVGYDDSLLGMVAPQLPSELMNKIAYNDRRGLMDYAKAYAGLLGF